MIKLLWATLGTLGFGMLFKANKNKLIYILIGGFLNYLGYMVSYSLNKNIFISSAVCAVVTTIYSNVMAIILKCPSTIFIFTGLISNIPGASLFYAMQNIEGGNVKEALNQSIITIEVILGIVSGILFVSTLKVIYNQIKIKIRKYKKERKII